MCVSETAPQGPLPGVVFCPLSSSRNLVLWSSGTVASSAAALGTLQCEGPASTRDSSCHRAGAVTGPRDRDFQVKGYTFSEPFHLIVSYGEAPRGAGPCGRGGLCPRFPNLPFGPAAPGKVPGRWP